MQNELEKQVNFLVYSTPEQDIKVNAVLKDESIWLTQKAMAELFGLKAYIIMAIMMGGGIGLRAAHIVPEVFIAFFYSGLGCALALAGVVFVINFICLFQLFHLLIPESYHF